jgi:XTP/dITP diphosphohydrolase
VKSVVFVSSNERKYQEVKSLLSKFDIDVKFVKKKLVELQADSMEVIALNKSHCAFLEVSKPLIVEDDGLFIEELNGFPGQYSAFVFKTIGNAGVIRLMNKMNFRAALFRSVFAFNNGKNSITFSGEIGGTMARREIKGGWGYDPIFIPLNSRMTYGALERRGTKGSFSHRAIALGKFAEWYINNSV